MSKTPTGGGIGVVTSIDEGPNTPFEAVARITVLPAATPVTTPVALTVATAGTLLLHVKVAPGTGALEMSNALAVSDVVPPMGMEALDGATVTLATTGGGGASVLQAPNEAVCGPAQSPVVGLRWSDMPTGVLFVSATPISVEVRPAAAPLAA